MVSMCITLPGRVTAIDPRGASVEIGGRRLHAMTLFAPEVRTGDWVIVSAGSIVGIIDAAEAEELTRVLREAEAIA